MIRDTWQFIEINKYCLTLSCTNKGISSRASLSYNSENRSDLLCTVTAGTSMTHHTLQYFYVLWFVRIWYATLWCLWFVVCDGLLDLDASCIQNKLIFINAMKYCHGLAVVADCCLEYSRTSFSSNFETRSRLSISTRPRVSCRVQIHWKRNWR